MLSFFFGFNLFKCFQRIFVEISSFLMKKMVSNNLHLGDTSKEAGKQLRSVDRLVYKQHKQKWKEPITAKNRRQLPRLIPVQVLREMQIVPFYSPWAEISFAG